MLCVSTFLIVCCFSDTEVLALVNLFLKLGNKCLLIHHVAPPPMGCLWGFCFQESFLTSLDQMILWRLSRSLSLHHESQMSTNNFNFKNSRNIQSLFKPQSLFDIFGACTKTKKWKIDQSINCQFGVRQLDATMKVCDMVDDWHANDFDEKTINADTTDDIGKQIVSVSTFAMSNKIKNEILLACSTAWEHSALIECLLIMQWRSNLKMLRLNGQAMQHAWTQLDTSRRKSWTQAQKKQKWSIFDVFQRGCKETANLFLVDGQTDEMSQTTLFRWQTWSSESIPTDSKMIQTWHPNEFLIDSKSFLCKVQLDVFQLLSHLKGFSENVTFRNTDNDQNCDKIVFSSSHTVKIALRSMKSWPPSSSWVLHFLESMQTQQTCFLDCHLTQKWHVLEGTMWVLSVRKANLSLLQLSCQRSTLVAQHNKTNSWLAKTFTVEVMQDFWPFPHPATFLMFAAPLPWSWPILNLASGPSLLLVEAITPDKACWCLQLHEPSQVGHFGFAQLEG